MRKNVLSLLLLLTMSAPILGQPIFYTPFERGLKDAFQLRFDEVEKDIQSMRENGEEEWRIAYIEHTVRFLAHFADENKEAYDDERSALKSRINDFEESAPQGVPEYYLYMGEMSLTIAALEAKFGHDWGAAGHGMDGLSALQKGQELFPQYKPMYAGMGILNVAIGSVPDDYQFITNMMGYRGDVTRGMNYLRQAIEASKERKYAYLKEKHAFLYGLIAQQLFPDEISSLEELNVRPDNSPLLAFLESSLLMSAGESDELISLLEEVTTNESFYTFPYLYYQLGRAKLARGDDDANTVLQEYILVNKGENYVKSTYRYLHWYHRLHSNSREAEHFRSLVLNEGIAKVGGDQQAEREMKRELTPLNLLRARLQFDNGDAQGCITTLRTVQVEDLSPLFKADYYYRMGRAHQKLSLMNSAKRNFDQCREIDLGETVTFEQVNAALQLAILNERDNPEYARSLFNAVLSYDDEYPWRHGMQQKAKAGLSRLDAA
ncbi:MAG: hypothetical protein HWD92_05880 [Flavobacteriia bacterium]|nr:hypothetical protein [Flavobacteriia bacterium]